MDKQKQIEEIAKEIARILFEHCLLNIGGSCEDCEWNGKETKEYDCQSLLVAKKLLEKYQHKIPEGAVVIPKEISFYDNVEERIRTFKLDGNKVDFTDEQIMALTQIFQFKEKQEKEIRKETAEKFAERLLEEAFADFSDDDYDRLCILVDEIAKEIKEGKV